uniref:PH domain-containing protein n=1 Tax=Gadus morhua TaxID=8049 RepID=A0A8C5BTM4_GADMO
MASIMEGPLSKWTNVMKGWQYRWFVLDYNAGLLSYYTSKDKMMRGSRRGCVRLRGTVIGIDDEDDSTFTITVDQKTFHFQGEFWLFSSIHRDICFFLPGGVGRFFWNTVRRGFSSWLAEEEAEEVRLRFSRRVFPLWGCEWNTAELDAVLSPVVVTAAHAV